MTLDILEKEVVVTTKTGRPRKKQSSLHVLRGLPVFVVNFVLQH